MKHGWKPTRLGDIIVENQKSKFKVRDSISGGKFPFFASGAAVSSLDEYICNGENLFLATGGKAYVQYYNGKAAYSTDCYSFTTRSDISSRFLFYFLESVLDDINDQMFEGAALRHLQKMKFRDISVPVPSIVEQRRIVSVLEETFASIAQAKANTERNLVNARELFKAVLESVLTDPNKRWKVEEFGTVIEILTDFHANGSYATLRDNYELLYEEDFALMVRSTDFENNFQNEMRYISKSSYEFLSKSKVYGGEIIISKIGNAGKVYLMPKIDRPCSLGLNLFLIRINDKKAFGDYIYHYLHSKYGEIQIQSRLNGTTTKTITKENVRNIKIPFPPLAEQRAIVSRLEALSTETKRLEAIYQCKLEALEELKKSVLQRAFEGEL